MGEGLQRKLGEHIVTTTTTAQSQAKKPQPLVCKGFASGLQAPRKLFASGWVLRASCVLDPLKGVCLWRKPCIKHPPKYPYYKWVVF